ncbi:hypothetical protein SAMN05216463_1446 [Xylanibacter ruminicola]|uniref:Uncharacterized protein n=1 Tax=Xylanibacter ruminicola TaxID=839 RepID=A0A1M6Z8Z9_XYLRU|nr:hypothetical protein SAMN05216463_1446 [Xylanibacter ruminicola]
MVLRKNKRGIRVKRCCASCKYKEIDSYGNRYCTKGYESHETCRHWRMRGDLRRCGRPDGVIKDIAYLRYVKDIRISENSGCGRAERGPERDIEEIRKDYNNNIHIKF